jgi:lipopolysaccharide/colanic/teichoic acid biosynthesis glycosyltransferase
MIKRAFDTSLSAAALLLLSPLLAVVAALVKIGSPGPVFFVQERVGRRFRPFLIYKFRTMRAGAAGRSISVDGDERVTAIGRMLRRTKIDELPQLWNVLKGDMSLVGPRPELRRFVQLFPREYSEILRTRPGMTDLASLEYRNESSVLALADDPEAEYVHRILPDKLRLAREGIRRSSMIFDIAIIAKTLVRVAGWTPSQ